MTNPTSNFGWQMPTPTDLVTDLPADFEVFGQAVDTSMANLKGGTTGQILSKATNTDMDFTWITNDVGDITAVTAGTGISGGGTSGAVTITNSMATAIDAKGDLIAGTGADTFARLATGTAGQILAVNTATATGLEWVTPNPGDITAVTVTAPITGGGTSGSVGIGISAASTSASGAVQLSDSTSTTSSVLAATPTAVKAAFDLATTANTAAGAAQTTANAAIPKSTVTTNGDVIYATGSAAVTRLGIGSSGQVLTVAGGVPTWATSSAVTPGSRLIKTVNYTAASTTNTDFHSQMTTSYKFYQIVFELKSSVAANSLTMKLAAGATVTSTLYYGTFFETGSSYARTVATNAASAKITTLGSFRSGSIINLAGVGQTLDLPLFYGNGFSFDSIQPNIFGYYIDNTGTNYNGFVLAPASGTFTGTISLYGSAI